MFKNFFFLAIQQENVTWYVLQLNTTAWQQWLKNFMNISNLLLKKMMMTFVAGKSNFISLRFILKETLTIYQKIRNFRSIKEKEKEINAVTELIDAKLQIELDMITSKGAKLEREYLFGGEYRQKLLKLQLFNDFQSKVS